MKIVVPFLCILVALGVVYGMAFTGILPAQKWADKNPQLAPLLRAAHLAKATKPKPAKVAAAANSPAKPVPLPLPAAPIIPLPVSAPVTAAAPAADMHAKLDAIYAAMAPDDLARIFAKLPDDTVVQSLMPMDEKKAGKVLAALPDDRAARLSRLMLAAPVQTASGSTAPAAALP